MLFPAHDGFQTFRAEFNGHVTSREKRLETKHFPKSIFLFGLKDAAKARSAALACREFQMRNVVFRSVIVHEDFENGLSKKDQSRITNAADKQFTSFVDFQNNAEAYFQRESETIH